MKQGVRRHPVDQPANYSGPPGPNFIEAAEPNRRRPGCPTRYSGPPRVRTSLKPPLLYQRTHGGDALVSGLGARTSLKPRGFGSHGRFGATIPSLQAWTSLKLDRLRPLQLPAKPRLPVISICVRLSLARIAGLCSATINPRLTRLTRYRFERVSFSEQHLVGFLLC